MRAFVDSSRRLAAGIPLDVRRALPLALVLALALGVSVWLGAHQSSAQPTEDKPFGWEGASSFMSAVQMVRKDLLLATTIPALVLGARALELRDPTRDGLGRIAGIFGMHAAILLVAAAAAGGIGAWGARRTPPDAYWAFTVAHGLLALAFYAIGFLFAAAMRRHALAASLAVWAVFVLFYDDFVEVRTIREVGLHGITAGQLPEWFYIAQAISPLSTYRGILILWREDFRDYVEQAVLGGATLPAWMTPTTFAAALVLLWVAIPLGIALGAWWLRGRLAARSAALAAPPAARTASR